jgi:hypothetical protein
MEEKPLKPINIDLERIKSQNNHLRNRLSTDNIQANNKKQTDTAKSFLEIAGIIIAIITSIISVLIGVFK